MRFQIPILFGLAIALLSPGPVRSENSGPPYRVIVNPANPIGVVDRSWLADAYLKKTTRWSRGETIRPVDLPPDSPARRKFSEEVLSRSVASVKSYWQQVIFSGRGVPPPELDTDAEVVRYVARHAGAVGYVSGSANVESVKLLTLK